VLGERPRHVGKGRSPYPTKIKLLKSDVNGKRQGPTPGPSWVAGTTRS
jgi:hypothetical protein